MRLRLTTPAPCLGAVFVLLLLLATPLTAAGFGQTLVQEIEPNASPATATPLGGTNVVAQGYVFGNGDVDYWSFSAVTGDRVYAAVMTSFSATGTFNGDLQLIGTNGSTVLESDSDDGSFGDLAPSIAGKTLTSSGTFYLKVTNDLGGQLRPYRLYLRVRSGSPSSEVETNDTEPQPLTIGWVSGFVNEGGDEDLYSLALAAGDTVFLSLDADPERNTTTFDPRLGFGLFGGALLTVDDPGASSPDSEASFFTVKDAGTYRAFVDDSSDNGSSSATYHLNVSVLPATEQGSSCTTYTSTDVPKSIPSGPGSVASTLTVPGSPAIADLDVSITLSHSNPPDLDVHLISPAGNDNGIVTDVGSSTYPSWNVRFDDEAATPPAGAGGGGGFTVLHGLGLQPELDYRLDWFDGEDAGGTWTLVLHDDMATASGTLTAWSLTICEPHPLPACPGGMQRFTVFASDFESDDGGFTHSGTADEWERGLPSYGPLTSCASGSKCWATDLDGTYNSSSDQSLVSPAISLAGFSAPIVVSWSQRYSMEGASYDTFWVDLQEVGGFNPDRVFEWLGPDMSETFGTGAATTASAGWGRFDRVASDAFAGETVELEFHLDSDPSINYPGLAIDDVSIQACAVPGTVGIFSDDFASGDICAWSTAVGSSDVCAP